MWNGLKFMSFNQLFVFVLNTQNGIDCWCDTQTWKSRIAADIVDQFPIGGTQRGRKERAHVRNAQLMRIGADIINADIMKNFDGDDIDRIFQCGSECEWAIEFVRGIFGTPKSMFPHLESDGGIDDGRFR